MSDKEDKENPRLSRLARLGWREHRNLQRKEGADNTAHSEQAAFTSGETHKGDGSGELNPAHPGSRLAGLANLTAGDLTAMQWQEPGEDDPPAATKRAEPGLQHLGRMVLGKDWNQPDGQDETDEPADTPDETPSPLGFNHQTASTG